MKTYGEEEVELHALFIWALEEGGNGQFYSQAPVTSRKHFDIH